MKEPTNADERIAALLDGRLDPREREALLAELAASDDDYDVFADTAALLRELEETEGEAAPAPDPPPADVVPLRPRAARRGAGGRWMALAAVLAALALTPVLVSRLAAPSAGDPVRLAARLEAGGAGLPEGWTGRPRWGLTRGSGGGEGLALEPLSAHLGALQVDLAVAARARDSAATAELARKIDGLLPGLSASGQASEAFQEVERRAGEPPERLEPLLEQGAEGIAAVGAEPFLEMGAWTEAARLAVVQQNAAFFRDRASRAMPARAAGDAALSPEARAAAAQVREALRAGGAPDWEVLGEALNALLNALAS